MKKKKKIIFFSLVELTFCHASQSSANWIATTNKGDWVCVPKRSIDFQCDRADRRISFRDPLFSIKCLPHWVKVGWLERWRWEMISLRTTTTRKPHPVIFQPDALFLKRDCICHCFTVPRKPAPTKAQRAPPNGLILRNVICLAGLCLIIHIY